MQPSSSNFWDTPMAGEEDTSPVDTGVTGVPEITQVPGKVSKEALGQDVSTSLWDQPMAAETGTEEDPGVSITMAEETEPSELPAEGAPSTDFSTDTKWQLVGDDNATIELGYGKHRIDTGLKWKSVANFFSDSDMEEVDSGLAGLVTGESTKLVEDDNTASLVATFVGIGSGIQNTTKGLAEIFGMDKESWKQDDEMMAQLYADDVYGGNATFGQFVGFVADPTALAVGGVLTKAGAILKSTAAVTAAVTKVGTANKIVQGGLKGAAAGTMWGTISHVNEYENQSRLENAAIGGIAGGVFGTAGAKVADVLALKAANKATQREFNVIQEYKDKVAETMIANNWSGRKTMLAVRKVQKESPELAAKAQALKTKHAVDWRWKEVLNDYQISQAVDSGLYTTTVNPARAMQMSTDGASTPNIVDKYLASVYYSIGKIDKKLAGRQYNYEAAIHTRPAQYIKQRSGFADYFPSSKSRKQVDSSIVQYTEEQTNQVKKWLLTGKFDEVESFLKRTRGDAAVQAFSTPKKILEELRDEQLEYGIISKAEKNYWPRVVKREEVAEWLSKYTKGNELPEDIAAKLEAANKRMLGANSRDMSPAETMQWLQRNYFGDEQVMSVYGARVQRKIKNIDDDMLRYYEDPIASFDSYIHHAVKEVELAKLLGGGDKALSKLAYENGIKLSTEGDNIFDKGLFDVEAALKASNIFEGLAPEQQDALMAVYRARFGAGEHSMPNLVRNYKALSNIAYLFNPVSSIKQSSDVANGYFKYGVVSSTKGLIRAVLRLDGRVTVEDAGLERFRYTEMENAVENNLTKVQDIAAKYSGWDFIDRIGKETILNAALDRAKKHANGTTLDKFTTRRWEKQLRTTYGDAAFVTLKKELKDFRSGDIPSPNMMQYLFTELAQLQPVTKSNMPVEYQNMKYGKALYSMKSYMLTQLEVQRKDIWNELFGAGFSKEERVRAVGRAAKYYSMLGAAGMGAQELQTLFLGQEEKSPFYQMDEMTQMDLALKVGKQMGLYAVFKPIGISEYTVDKLLSKDVVGAVWDIVQPPDLGMGTAISEGIDVAKGNKPTQAGLEKLWEKERRLVPWVGPFLKAQYAPIVYDERDPRGIEPAPTLEAGPKEYRAREWK